MVWSGVIWGLPKVCYYQPKNQQLKGKNEQENLIGIFLSQINLDEHVSMKINTKYWIYKGVWGASPPEAEETFKK